MSNRSSLLGNNHRGFQQIPEVQSSQRPQGSGDATIDIPLTQVPTKQSSKGHKSPIMNEKHRSLGPGPGRRRLDPRKPQEGEDSLTSMGRIYQRMLNFSIVTRYLLYLLPVGAIISVPIIIGATAAPGAKMGGIRIGPYTEHHSSESFLTGRSLDICLGTYCMGRAVGVQALRKNPTLYFRVPLRHRQLGHAEVLPGHPVVRDSTLACRLGTGVISHLPAHHDTELGRENC